MNDIPRPGREVIDYFRTPRTYAVPDSRAEFRLETRVREIPESERWKYDGAGSETDVMVDLPGSKESVPLWAEMGQFSYDGISVADVQLYVKQKAFNLGLHRNLPIADERPSVASSFLNLQQRGIEHEHRLLVQRYSREAEELARKYGPDVRTVAEVPISCQTCDNLVRAGDCRVAVIGPTSDAVLCCHGCFVEARANHQANRHVHQSFSLLEAPEGEFRDEIEMKDENESKKRKFSSSS